MEEDHRVTGAAFQVPRAHAGDVDFAFERFHARVFRNGGTAMLAHSPPPHVDFETSRST